MGFEYPAWLLGTALIAPLVWLYLRVRPRPPAVVSSLRIWRLVPPPSTPPRSRPKLPPLFFIQAALILASAVALAGPYRREPRPPGPPRDAVVILDASASMQSRDGVSTRFARAVRGASERLQELAAEGRRVTLLRAGPQPEVVATGVSADDAHAALSSLHPLDTTASLTAAIELGASLAGHDGSIDVYSDVAADDIVMSGDARRVTSVHAYGSGGDNVAVREVRVQANPFEQERGARILVGVQSYSASPREVELEIVPLSESPDDPSREAEATETTASAASDDEAAPARIRSIRLDPRSRTVVPFDGVRFTGAFEARLHPEDDLPLDDVVYGYVPPAHRTDVLVVGDDVELGRTLQWLAERAGTFVVRATSPGAYDPSEAGEITVFDRYVPDLPPPSNTAYLAPSGGNADVTVMAPAGTVQVAERRDHSLLHGVWDASVLLGPHPAGLAPGALRPVLLGRSEGREVALVQAGDVGGRRIVATAFRIDPAALTRPDDLPSLVFTLNLLSFLSPEPAEAPLLRTAGERLRAGSRLAAPIEELAGPEGTRRLAPAGDLVLERAGVYEARSRSGTRPVYVSFIDDGESDILRSPAPDSAPAVAAGPAPGLSPTSLPADESSWTHVPYLREVLLALATLLLAEWALVAAGSPRRPGRPAPGS